MKKISKNTPTIRARPKRVFAARALTSFVISEKKVSKKADMSLRVARCARPAAQSLFSMDICFLEKDGQNGYFWAKWIK